MRVERIVALKKQLLLQRGFLKDRAAISTSPKKVKWSGIKSNALLSGPEFFLS